MSGRIFQNIVLQFKETTDTVIGVIDSEYLCAMFHLKLE